MGILKILSLRDMATNKNELVTITFSQLDNCCISRSDYIMVTE